MTGPSSASGWRSPGPPRTRWSRPARSAHARRCDALAPAFLDSLVQLGGGAVAYLIVALLVAGDGLLPVMPGEIAVITGAALAATGRLSPFVLAAAAVAGGLAGDNASFWLGRAVGGRVARRLFRAEKARRRLEWARSHIEQRGAGIIAVARFLPGGRTAATFASGTLGLAWRRFAVGDSFGVALWVLYAGALGWAGGTTFAHSTGKAVLISLAAGALLTGVLEAARRLRRKGRVDGSGSG